MRTAPARGDWRGWLSLALAVFLLNLGLSFHNVWPTPWVETRHELSIEAAVLLAVLALYAELVRPPPARLARWLALLVTLLVLGRYAQVTAPALYGRPINLYWEAQHIPAVVAMLARAAPGWLVIAGTVAGVALLGGIYWLTRWVLARTLLCLHRPAQRRTLGVAAGSLLVLYIGGKTSAHIDTGGWFSIPVTTTYARQVGFVWEALAGRDASALAEGEPLPPSDLGALAGADVFVVFLESYGAAAFDRSDYSEALQQRRQAFNAVLARTGRRAVSAFVESPTFAGGSWRAHASLLSGLEVSDDRTYSLLLTQPRETLVHRFAAQGYRPVALMPGLRQEWPEGSFYGFASLYGERRLDYRGPEFGWWRLPDQYALARLDRLEVATAPRDPLFLFFPTISTHMPFRPTPPYQPDWQRLLSAHPYPSPELAASQARKPDWGDLGPAYVDALSYAFAYLGGYLERRAPAELVLVLIGDHQPAANVSGEEAPWEVPVHVIARRPAVLDALRAQGFQTGMTPQRPALGRMDELTAVLLHAFDTRAAPALAASDPLEPGVDVAGAGALGELSEEAEDNGGTDPVGRDQTMTLAD